MYQGKERMDRSPHGLAVGGHKIFPPALLPSFHLLHLVLALRLSHPGSDLHLGHWAGWHWSAGMLLVPNLCSRAQQELDNNCWDKRQYLGPWLETQFNSRFLPHLLIWNQRWCHLICPCFLGVKQFNEKMRLYNIFHKKSMCVLGGTLKISRFLWAALSFISDLRLHV